MDIPINLTSDSVNVLVSNEEQEMLAVSKKKESPDDETRMPDGEINMFLLDGKTYLLNQWSDFQSSKK